MVTINNFQFSPSVVTIKAGTEVIWANQDDSSHCIVSDASSPQVFSSGLLIDGAYYRVAFNRQGRYPYHCSLHPSMNGTIIVQP